jgi:hypothetical protein
MLRIRHILAALLLIAAPIVYALNPITPVTAGSKTISATTSSAATALATSTLITGAVATGYPVLSGQTKVVTVPANVTHVATITGSGTATVYVTLGQGE